MNELITDANLNQLRQTVIQTDHPNDFVMGQNDEGVTKPPPSVKTQAIKTEFQSSDTNKPAPEPLDNKSSKKRTLEPDTQPDSSATESLQNEFPNTKRLKTEPKVELKTESVKTESVKTEAVKTDAVKTDAVKTEAVKTEAVKTEQKEEEPVKCCPTLHKAVKDNHMDCVELLLSENVNIQKEDEMRRQATHFAAEHGRLECLKLLHFHKGNIHARDVLAWQPIHLAAMSGHIHCLDFLTNAGADISANDNRGQQPLHFAVKGNRVKCVKYLISRQADVQAIDQINWRPFEYAKQYNFLECMSSLDPTCREMSENTRLSQLQDIFKNQKKFKRPRPNEDSSGTKV